jgi:hypothetical protein
MRMHCAFGEFRITRSDRIDNCRVLGENPGAWSKNEEPSLDEVLTEPAVRLLMARDHVTEDTVRKVAREALQRITSRAPDIGQGVTAATTSPAVISGSP